MESGHSESLIIQPFAESFVKEEECKAQDLLESLRFQLQDIKNQHDQLENKQEDIRRTVLFRGNEQ